LAQIKKKKFKVPTATEDRNSLFLGLNFNRYKMPSISKESRFSSFYMTKNKHQELIPSYPVEKSGVHRITEW